MFLMKLVVQFIHLGTNLFQGPFAGGRDFVNPAPAPAHGIERGPQQTRALQPMQQRIESAWPDPVTVVPELLHHAQPEDRLLHRMREHMDADQPVK